MVTSLQQRPAANAARGSSPAPPKGCERALPRGDRPRWASAAGATHGREAHPSPPASPRRRRGAGGWACRQGATPLAARRAVPGRPLPTILRPRFDNSCRDARTRRGEAAPRTGGPERRGGRGGASHRRAGTSGRARRRLAPTDVSPSVRQWSAGAGSPALGKETRCDPGWQPGIELRPPPSPPPPTTVPHRVGAKRVAQSGLGSRAKRRKSRSAKAVASMPWWRWWPFRPGRAEAAPRPASGFQSPSRDGARSGSVGARRRLAQPPGFNPPVGMVAVQACAARMAERVAQDVSIPQSGWWPFRPTPGPIAVIRPTGFNPPVGMVAVQATGAGVYAPGASSFNPPVGMVAVQASVWPRLQGGYREFQSPSRDGGRSGPGSLRPTSAGSSFNPPVGMVAVQARRPCGIAIHCGRFNPPVGMVAVQAALMSARGGRK